VPLVKRIQSAKLRGVIGLFVIAAIFFILIRIAQHIFGINAPEYRTAKVEEGPLVATISASGTLNPVKSVTVGTQVTGMIKELDVDFNSPVKKGQVIARVIPPLTTALRSRVN